MKLHAGNQHPRPLLEDSRRARTHFRPSQIRDHHPGFPHRQSHEQRIHFEPFTTGQLEQADDTTRVTKMLAGPLQWVTVDSGVHFDRVVWIARDPRDVAVSRCLYQFWGGHRKNEREKEVYALIEQKVGAPASLPFHRVYQPVTREVDSFIEDDRTRYRLAADQLGRRAGEWFMFHYEDMVSGNCAPWLNISAST